VKNGKNYNFINPLTKPIEMEESRKQEILRSMVKENVSIENEKEMNALIEEAYK
jgi:hypothetical protein